MIISLETFLLLKLLFQKPVILVSDFLKLNWKSERRIIKLYFDKTFFLICLVFDEKGDF